MGSFTPPPTTALAPGDRLDRYELLCVLAQGGMGSVWLARLTGKLGFERLVAVKTILPTYTTDQQFCAMFLDEAGIAAQVDHENVARILEIGEDRGFLYYAMELIDGESMRKLYRDIRMQGQIFPLGVALRICADACAGLHAVHELRGPDGRYLEVVHRDVSPQNILVSVRGTTKLIDFGVAKARERRTEDTTAGTLKGKLEYMAPEQASGEPIDRRADVYSMGAILYELLAGRPVRDCDEGRQLLALHELVTGAPYPPLPANVPHLVRSVVDRALMRDPNMRYRSADELRHAIEQVILATGQGASTDDVATVLAHFSRERTQKRKEAIDEAIRAAEQGRAAPQQPQDAVRQEKTIVAPVSTRRQGGVRTGPQLAPYAASGSGAFAAVPAAMQSGAQLPIVSNAPHDGPPTGPSMRTMEGASLSARPPGFVVPPPRTSPTRVFAGILVLALVALLGVVAGVVIAKKGLPGAVTPVAATGGDPTPVPVPVPVPVGASTTPPVPAVGDIPPPVVVSSPPAPAPISSHAGSASTSSTSTSSPSASASAAPSARPTSGGATKPQKPPPPPPPAGPRRIGGNKPEASGDEYGF